MYRINDNLKHRIIALCEDAISVSDIADELGITRKTVYLWKQRWADEGVITNNVSFCRPKRTSAMNGGCLFSPMRPTITRGREIPTIRQHKHICCSVQRFCKYNKTPFK